MAKLVPALMVNDLVMYSPVMLSAANRYPVVPTTKYGAGVLVGVIQNPLGELIRSSEIDHDEVSITLACSVHMFGESAYVPQTATKLPFIAINTGKTNPVYVPNGWEVQVNKSVDSTMTVKSFFRQ